MNDKITIDGVEISRDKLRELIKDHPELVQSEVNWRAELGGDYYAVGSGGYVNPPG